jgi:hypothetical protein
MRLNEATVAIRPRSPWEAIDLGLLLAGRHRRLLMGSWALVTLPLYAVLTLLLWKHPTAVFVVIWWLKPALDRLPLHILSKALFEQPPGITAAVRQWLRLLRPQLLASLTWRRFSLSRSFTLPVQQLEGLDGQARLQRMAVLRQGNQGAARWLTTVGVHLETLLVLGFSTLLYMLTPTALEDQWDWQRLMAAAQADWLWLEHLNNLFYVVVLLVWEPLYVACGFTLYLNRRTVLEAWDIELQFRRLAQRLAPAAALVLLVVVLGTALPSPPAYAQPPATDELLQAPATLAPSPLAPAANSINPQSPRLLNQPLTSQASRNAAQMIVQQPPFKNVQQVTRWRFNGASSTPTPSLPAPPSALLGALARGIELLLWALLIAGGGLLLWRYREWLGSLAGRLPVLRKRRRTSKVPRPLASTISEALPADIASHAEQLWPHQPREALGLLYRGLLWHLQHDQHLVLHGADTEGQVLERVAALNQPALEAFSQRLTRHWQALAYGHQLPSDEARAQLLAEWRQLFTAQAAR